MKRHRGAKGPGDREPRGNQPGKVPLTVPRAPERSPGVSDHRVAPTSKSPREETEETLPLRTCLTAFAYFRSSEGTGELGAVAGPWVSVGLGPRGTLVVGAPGAARWCRSGTAAGLTLRGARLLGAAYRAPRPGGPGPWRWGWSDARGWLRWEGR